MNVVLIYLVCSTGFRGDNDNEEFRTRSKSFPVDPANMHMAVSPQSSMDSDDDNQLRKMNSLAGENPNPGMKG